MNREDNLHAVQVESEPWGGAPEGSGRTRVGERRGDMAEILRRRKKIREPEGKNRVLRWMRMGKVKVITCEQGGKGTKKVIGKVQNT